jgi:hypothetical protein
MLTMHIDTGDRRSTAWQRHFNTLEPDRLRRVLWPRFCDTLRSAVGTAVDLGTAAEQKR